MLFFKYTKPIKMSDPRIMWDDIIRQNYSSWELEIFEDGIIDFNILKRQEFKLKNRQLYGFLEREERLLQEKKKDLTLRQRILVEDELEEVTTWLNKYRKKNKNKNKKTDLVFNCMSMDDFKNMTYDEAWDTMIEEYKKNGYDTEQVEFNRRAWFG